MKYIALLCMLLPSVAMASSAEWELVGKGEMHKLFWHVYDTELKTENGVYDPAKPYKLENTYHMDFTAKELAEKSIEEMHRHAEFTDAQAANWQTQLEALWPDVKEGDRIGAVATPNKQVEFFHNARKVGAISDPDFVEPFMDIWLGKNTSEPDLRAALLNQK